MIRIYLTNHEYFLSGEFATLDAAMVKARQTCFQVAFHQDGEVIGSWCPIGGFRDYRRSR